MTRTPAIVFVCAALSTLMLASTAAAAPPAKKQEDLACFYRRNLDSWTAVDRRTVNLKVNLRDYYQLKLAGDCPDIDWDQTIGLESRGSDWICSGLGVTVIAPSPIGPQRCAATSLRKLSTAEVAALPPKDKP